MIKIIIYFIVIALLVAELFKILKALLNKIMQKFRFCGHWKHILVTHVEWKLKNDKLFKNQQAESPSQRN